MKLILSFLWQLIKIIFLVAFVLAMIWSIYSGIYNPIP